MDAWTLHWLEASGSLVELRSDLIGEFEAAYKTLSRLIPPPRLDVLIQRLPGETIPEMGLLGRAYRSSMFTMTIDPDNAFALEAGIVSPEPDISANDR